MKFAGSVVRMIAAAIVTILVLCSHCVAGGADVSTKDYPSIQAAIDANPGREIHVPAGDHSVAMTIRITGEGTSLVGSGRLLMTDPARHILEIEHARNIRIEGLTFSRPEGKMETQKEGLLVSDARDVTLERVKVIDNHTRSGSIRLSDVRNGRILNCEVRNYMLIAIDERTQSVALLGYAFRCIDGTGIVCDRCRGTLIQGNRIIEESLRPTPEINPTKDPVPEELPPVEPPQPEIEPYQTPPAPQPDFPQPVA